MQRVTENDIDILARTLYGEARCEYTNSRGGLASLIAVANVIMNRSKKPERFGDSIEKVCLRPWQFSCWNAKDPMRKVIVSDSLLKDPVFKVCQEVARGVALENWPDLTHGSDHYHADYCKPAWADLTKINLRLCHHYFYKLG